MSGGAQRPATSTPPEGEVVNSQSRSAFADIGAAWTGKRAYVGGSYGYVDTEYGIPVVEDGVLRLTPKRHAFTLRGGARNLTGLFDEVRSTWASAVMSTRSWKATRSAPCSATTRRRSTSWDRTAPSVG